MRAIPRERALTALACALLIVGIVDQIALT